MKSRLKMVVTNRFEKTLVLMKKRRKDTAKLQVFLDLLMSRSDIPVKYKNHKLKGNFNNRWECHIEPDWLLIYYIDDTMIKLEYTGTHSDLFK